MTLRSYAFDRHLSNYLLKQKNKHFNISRTSPNSLFGIVVLSQSFFSKEWPQRELDGLVAKEISSGKLILPIWHNVTKEDVAAFSPILADRVAVSSDKGMEQIVKEILAAINKKSG